MKSLHDYTGERRAAGKRMRRLARRGADGKTMALAMREYDRAGGEWLNALMRYLYPAKRMRNMRLYNDRPLLSARGLEAWLPADVSPGALDVTVGT